VRAHSRSTDRISRANARADRAAKRGTSKEPALRFPWGFINEATIGWEGGVSEGQPQSELYRKLEEDKFLSGFDSTYRRLDMQNFDAVASLDAFKDPKREESVRFLFKAFTRTLPTMDRLAHQWPDLISDQSCAFCTERESDCHLFNECPAHSARRTELLHEVERKLASGGSATALEVQREIRPWLAFSEGDNDRWYPSDDDNFTGRIPEEVAAWLKARVGNQQAACVMKQLNQLVVRYSQELWITRCQGMKEQGRLIDELRLEKDRREEREMLDYAPAEFVE